VSSGPRLRQSTQDGANNEQNQRRLQDELTAEGVAKLSCEGHCRRRCNQVCGNDGGHLVQTTQITGHSRQGSSHDRLVESPEKHHEQDSRKRRTDGRRHCDASALLAAHRRVPEVENC
jgi:hypothetical protein